MPLISDGKIILEYCNDTREIALYRVIDGRKEDFYKGNIPNTTSPPSLMELWKLFNSPLADIKAGLEKLTT